MLHCNETHGALQFNEKYAEMQQESGLTTSLKLACAFCGGTEESGKDGGLLIRLPQSRHAGSPPILPCVPSMPTDLTSNCLSPQSPVTFHTRLHAAMAVHFWCCLFSPKISIKRELQPTEIEWKPDQDLPSGAAAANPYIAADVAAASSGTSADDVRVTSCNAQQNQQHHCLWDLVEDQVGAINPHRQQLANIHTSLSLITCCIVTVLIDIANLP
jgi:hypothetical protein